MHDGRRDELPTFGLANTLWLKKGVWRVAFDRLEKERRTERTERTERMVATGWRAVESKGVALAIYTCLYSASLIEKGHNVRAISYLRQVATGTSRRLPAVNGE